MNPSAVTPDRHSEPLPAGLAARRPRRLSRVIGVLGAFLGAIVLGHAAEVIPPAPRNHFNDYAGAVRRETAAQLNAELAQFERDTSTQILVALYPRMQSDSSIEDYTVRVFEAWHPGQKRQSNGAILFVFTEDRRMRIATGYGLEGALPDALCRQIIENELVPRFRAGDYDAGLTAGVRAMLAAVRGEYRGSGRTAAESVDLPSGALWIALGVGGLILMGLLRRAAQRNVVYGRGRRRTVWVGNPWGGGWGGGGWGGGGWGGGSSWGGGGGGTFSGGGGHTGGGGASGRW